MAYSLTMMTWRATAIRTTNRPKARNIRRRLGGATAGRLKPSLGRSRLARSSDERGRRRLPPSVSLSAMNDTFVQYHRQASGRGKCAGEEKRMVCRMAVGGEQRDGMQSAD